MAKDIREEMLEAAAQADEAASSKPRGECIRILQCFECRTVEEMPDYPSQANPNDDVVLHYIDERHGGHTEMPHNRTLHQVEKEKWDNPKIKRMMVDQMWETTKGFKPSYYDTKSTLVEDAGKCFNLHRRQVPCIDWQDSSKKLQPPTRSMREKLARDMPRNFGGDRDAIAKGGPVTYLCQFCPVSTAVEYAKRKARGED